MIMRGRPRLAGLVTVVLLVPALAGCTGGRAPADSHRDAARVGVPAAALHASVTQSRFDEGTSRLRAGVVNDSGRDITVTRATLSWDGLRFSSVRLAAEPVHPGQAAAFTVDYSSSRCGRPPASGPRLVVVVDGRVRRLPLKVDVPGLLLRLRADACARVRLDRQAAVRLVLARATAGTGTSEHLPGALVLTRPVPARAVARPVRVVAVQGSVLFTLSAARHLPVTLRPGRDRLVVPVAVGSTLRCDGHARGQASQPFLFAAYLQTRGGGAQRVVLVPAGAQQQRLLAMLDRVCR